MRGSADWVLDALTPSPSRCARHLSPFPGARMGAQPGRYPLPHAVGERCHAQHDGEGAPGHLAFDVTTTFTNPPWPMGTPATPTVQTVGAWGDQTLVGAGDSLLFPARARAATAAAFLREESKLSPGFREAAHA